MCKCKNRRERNEEARKVVHRSTKGKKGYEVKDEKEEDDDDSDEDEDMSIDYEKPTLN